jgi:hypothetical protein
LLLRQWPEDQPDDRRRHREAQSPHGKAEQAHHIHHPDVEHRVVQAVRAKRGEDENRAIEKRLGNFQQPGPHGRQREVQHQQHHVADVEAGDQSPHQIGVGREQQRPRLQVVLLKGDEEDRRRRGRGQPERE